MTVRLTHLFTYQDYLAMGDDAVKRGLWRNDPSVFLPGMAWYQNWYYDPSGTLERSMCERGDSFLSVHYWEMWSHIRPPICVVCPNGETWEIDRRSSNGSGWVVTGDFPTLTCSPSIVVEGYHGFLQGGQFTPDLEGRGPNGAARPYTPRSET